MIHSPVKLVESPIAELESAVQPFRNDLVAHPVYRAIRTIDDLRWFMENHVLAVWDFMSLLKSLQARLTSVSSPWRPIGSPSVRRFVNEIVLGKNVTSTPMGVCQPFRNVPRRHARGRCRHIAY